MKNAVLIYTATLALSSSSLMAVELSKQWQGSNYSENSQPQKAWFDNLSSDLHIAGHEDILDLGCGDGKITMELAKKIKTGSITGIDISKNMIEFAKKNNQQKNLSFSVGDARNFKINKKFDLIVSFTALHWIKEYEQVIRQAKEHLKPNGKIYFILSTKMQYFPIGKSLDILCKTKKWAPYFINYNPGYYSHEMDPLMASLVKNGFLVEEMSLRRKLTIFENEDKLLSWLKAWMPHQYQVPKGQGDQFIKDFIKEYTNHGTKGSDGIYWKGFLLKIEASLEQPIIDKKSN